MSDQTFSAEDLRLVVETSCAVVHYHSDLRRIFVASGVPNDLLDSLPPPRNPEWGHTKREVSDHVITGLAKLGDQGIGPLRRIVHQVANWSNFATATDIDRARTLVRQLKTKVEAQQEKHSLERDRKLMVSRAMVLEQPARKAYVDALSRLHDTFLTLMQDPNPQRRGYALQHLLYDLFELSGLRPLRPFRVQGGEVDGAFILDSDHFLLEARWRNERASRSDLVDFSEKVRGRIECTRGLFVSVSGFSSQGIDAFKTGRRPNILLMEGAHLVAVFEDHIGLADMLRRMIHRASTTVQIFTPLSELC